VLQRVVVPAGALIAFRFSNAQSGDHPDRHDRGHGQIGHLPGLKTIKLPGGAKQGGQIERAGPGNQHADTVAGDITGGQQGLHGGTGAFDAIGINDNILSGRGKAEQNRGQGHHYHVAITKHRICTGHPDDGRHHRQLGYKQPGTPPTQQAGKHRHGHLINEWGPKEFKGIPECGPAEKSDCGPVDPGLAQPDREGGKYQQDGNTCRKPEKEQGRHLGREPGPVPTRARQV